MTDWPKLITELESAGLGISKIALIVGCQYTQIQRLKKGSDVYSSLGDRIKELHETYIRNTRADIPTKE